MVCTEGICQGTGASNENVAVAGHQKGTTFTVYSTLAPEISLNIRSQKVLESSLRLTQQLCAHLLAIRRAVLPCVQHRCFVYKVVTPCRLLTSEYRVAE